jgi:hypothetical protein
MRRGPPAALPLLLAALAALACRGAPRGTDEARSRLQVLDEILASGNDNDPRLDNDFNALSPEAKRLFRERYRGFAPELRNHRGTIVFLLGRNLSAPEDWAFLRGVAAEPPCLSLADCARAGEGGHGMGDEVTLAYPSLVALEQARRVLEESGGKGPAAREALGVVAAAKASRVKAVARKAADIERRFAP